MNIADRLRPSQVLQDLSDEPRPAGLVACAAAATGVAVEVLVEWDQVAPVGILVESLAIAEDGAFTVLVAQEDAREPPRELVRHLIQVHELSRAGGALHPEVVAEI